MYNKENIQEAFFSANLHYFIPEIDFNNHSEMFLSWSNYHGKKKDGNLTFPELDELKRLPAGIIVLYHLGYHLETIHYFASQGLKFDILLSKEVRLKYASYFQQLINNLKIEDVPLFLDAEDKSVLIKISKSIKAQRNILVFADGFLGVENEKVSSKTLIPIDFFSNKIYVRKGISFLSFIYSLPIYTLVNFNNKGNIQLTMQERINPRNVETKNEYYFRSMSEIFSVLSDRISEDVIIWECWPYLHRVNAIKFSSCLKPKKLEESGAIVNIEIDSRQLIFDKLNYKFFDKI